MRSLPNNSLPPRDTAIADLALVLSDEAFADALRAAAPWLALQHAASVYVRYKPHTSCLVGFQLLTGRGAGYCHVSAFAESSRSKLTARLRRGAQQTALRSEPLVIPLGACASVTFFPLDQRVRALLPLWDDRERQGMLALQGIDRPTAQITSVAYKPERRYVARLTLPHDRAVALKAYTAAAFSRVLEINRALVGQGLARMPRLESVSERHAVAAWSWHRGTPLSILLETDRAAASDLQHVGTALAALHDAPHFALAQHSHDASIALRDLADWLGWVEPSFSEPVARTLAKLSDTESAPQPTLTHGDFYSKQVIMNDGEPLLLDFDCASVGDPLADVGNFIAHLEFDVIRGRISRSVADSAVANFLSGYAEVRDVSAAAFSQHVAKSLLRLAPGPFRQRTPDWIAQTHLLLGTASQWLASAKASLVEVLS